jgi:UDP-N-acetylmuramyl pentapeptide phosphotransferase/UDP-N-acetylglucosamine-1-phosphate transferase
VSVTDFLFLIPRWILIGLGFSMAFGITYYTIPSIVYISRSKNLCSCPNGRTSHTKITPTLGGIAIFIGLILTTVIFAGSYFIYELKYIIAAMIIVFFVGVKDDILIIDPMKKLAGQIIAIILITVFADIRITNLFGLFQITQLPYLASILLTIFVFVVVINGFNLIDGIDGLAAGIGILSSSVFGAWFWLTGNVAYAVLSFAFVGSLSAFFLYNVFGTTNKIFLGDTGSLLTGLVVGILACRFMQQELVTRGAEYISSTPAFVISILIIPLFDSLRVFIIRIYQGKSPFKADRQHIHHYMLQLGYTHLQSTLILILVNQFFIVLSFFLRDLGIIWLTAVILSLACLLTSIVVTLAKERSRKTFDIIESIYSTPEIRTDRNKIAGVMEKHTERRAVVRTREEVNLD